MKPVVRLRTTLQYCHPMLVFWLAVCFEQVAIQISICCLSKRFFILEYCELTAMESNITSVSKREKVISLVVGLKQLFFLRILPVESASQLWFMTIIRWCEKCFGSSFDSATLGFVCSVSCGSGCELQELFRRNGESLSLTFRCTRL